MVIDHDEARELLPDFALDLLEQDEHGEILDHLRRCDVCLTEAQLYLQGARALSLAAAHEPRALSLRGFVPRVPDGALERIRVRVAEGPAAEHEGPAHRAAPSREVAEAGGRGGWRLFGKSRGKEATGRSATGLLERGPLPGGAFAEAVGPPAVNPVRPAEDDEFDDFGTDSFEDLFRPRTPPPAGDDPTPLDDGTLEPALAARGDAGGESELELTDLAEDLDWLLLGTVETEEPFDTADPADHLWDEPEDAPPMEEPLAPAPARRERRVLGRQRERDEPVAPLAMPPSLPSPAPVLDPGPPTSQRLAARLHTQAARTTPPAPAAKRRLFGRAQKPDARRPDPPEEDFSGDPYVELAAHAPATETLDELTGALPEMLSPDEIAGSRTEGSPPDPLAEGTPAGPAESASAHAYEEAAAQATPESRASDDLAPPGPGAGAALAGDTESRTEATDTSIEVERGGQAEVASLGDATAVIDPAPTPGETAIRPAAPAADIDALLSGVVPEEEDARPAAPLRAAAAQPATGRRRFGLGRRPANAAAPFLTPIVSAPAERKRRFLGRRAAEPAADDFADDIYAEALAIPARALAPSPAREPSAAPRAPVSPAAIPGLGGYYDDDLDDEDEDYDEPSTAGAGWKMATFVLVLAVIALTGGLGFTFYTLLTTRNDLNAIEARLPSYAIQVGFKGEDLQGIGYFSSDYKRAVLSLDGVKPAPAGKTIVIWSTSRKDGTKALSALTADRNGGRVYFELRRVPPDVVRIFATVEPAGRTLPPVPTGPEIFTGDAPFQPR